MSLNIETTRGQVLSELGSEGTSLRPTTTLDKSGAVYKTGEIPHIKNCNEDREEFLKTVSEGKELKTSEEGTKDASFPVLENLVIHKIDRQGQLEAIESGAQLKHTETDDKSGPLLPASTNIVIVKDVMEEIVTSKDKKKESLKSPETIADRSSPAIESNIKVKKIDRKGLIKGVEEPHDLTHPDSVSDRSAPLIDSDIKVKKVDRKGYLDEIQHGAYLKKTAWINMQKKTFTNWMNSHLRKSGCPRVADIEVDLDDGLSLMRLITHLYNIAMPRHNKVCRMHAHKLDNLAVAFSLIEESGVRLHNIRPMSILNHNLTMILGMIWTIIHDYQIKGISVEELTAKEGLLLWCKKVTKGYKNVNVENFTSSFQDGLAFNAIIHFHRSDLLNYDELSKDNAPFNLENAFNIAEKELDIYKLFDVEDFEGIPDERSVMTYVSEFFHYFSSRAEVDIAGRRIANLIDFTKSDLGMKEEYIEGARKLVSWANRKILEFEKKVVATSIDVVKEELTTFRSYKRREKAMMTTKKYELEALSNQIRTRLALHNRPDFAVPEEITINTIDSLWEKLGNAEKIHGDEIRANLKRLEDIRSLLRRWNIKAKKQQLRLNIFIEEADEIMLEVAGEKSVEAVKQWITQFATVKANFLGLDSELDSLKSIAQKIQELGFYETDESDLSLDQVVSAYEATKLHIENLNEQLQQELQKQVRNEEMRVEFAQKAQEFHKWIINSKDVIVGISGDLKNQLDVLKVCQSDNSKHEADIRYLENLNRQIEERDISENKHTDLHIEELSLIWDQVQSILVKKVKFVEKQIASEKTTAIPAEMMAEFRETFNYFDKDNSSTLNSLEFRACLASLGHSLSDEQLAACLAEVDISGDGKIQFDEFVKFMVNRVKDVDTKKQIEESFSIVAENKPFVTEGDLRKVLKGDNVAFLVDHMPKVDGGLDHQTWVNNIMSN